VSRVRSNELAETFGVLTDSTSGDITRGDGTGGEHTLGGTSSKFNDENFDLKHSVGCLSMANCTSKMIFVESSHCIDSWSQYERFSILLVYCRNAVARWKACRVSETLRIMLCSQVHSFGKVVAGQEVVAAIEEVGSSSGKTRMPVMISDSGQLR